MDLKGVLLMSLGSPENLEEMEAYLTEVRRGNKPSPELVRELQERYRQGGGRSPLLEIAKRQAGALQDRLNRNGERFRVYVGMRHWRPYIHDVMEQIAADGVAKLVSLPLTPYYSRLSTEAYHKKVKEAKEKFAAGLELVYVESWNVDPLLVDTYSDLLLKGLSKFSDQKGVKILFTAHSLPARVIKEKDPYPDQIRETIELVAAKLNFKGWEFAYQSQGATGEPWLGPTVEEMLEKFRDKGIQDVLICPIGFVCDHMEILYDIDILFKNFAKEKGIRLERTPSPNDSPLFIRTLESVVLKSFSASEERAAAP